MFSKFFYLHANAGILPQFSYGHSFANYLDFITCKFYHTRHEVCCSEFPKINHKKVIQKETRIFYLHLSDLYVHVNYLLTPRCRVLLEKLTGLQLVKKFPTFHRTRRFITALKASATCPYPGSAQSSPYTHIPPPGDPS